MFLIVVGSMFNKYLTFYLASYSLYVQLKLDIITYG